MATVVCYTEKHNGLYEVSIYANGYLVTFVEMANIDEILSEFPQAVKSSDASGEKECSDDKDVIVINRDVGRFYLCEAFYGELLIKEAIYCSPEKVEQLHRMGAIPFEYVGYKMRLMA